MSTTTTKEIDTQLTLYDMNKSAMVNQKPLTKNAFNMKLKLVEKFFTKNKQYFMLLCHDKRDYTVFNLKSVAPMREALEAFAECVYNRGEPLAIDYDDAGAAIEIWLKIGNDAFAYYLFPYDAAIIEC